MSPPPGQNPALITSCEYASRVMESAPARSGARLPEKRLTASAGAINGRRVTEQELRKIDPQLTSFFNVNTPEDYQRALKLAGIER